MKSVQLTLYCHINRVNGKRYVGQTVDTMEERWREHLSAAKANRGSPALGAAIRKYGADAFDHRVLEIVSTQEAADLAETRWIAQFSARAPDGYNIAVGGKGPGYHHEDTKRRIGAASKRRLERMTPEQRAANLLNLRWTPERKDRHSARERTPEERAKMSAAQKASWAKLTPEEKSARALHQISGLSAEQKSARMRKAWVTRRAKAAAAGGAVT